MRHTRQTIGLSMIVKNEAPVIRRCLDSVMPLIDHWVIVDTGSSDGTQDIIRSHMAGLPGTVYEREWRDFAHNRSEALSLARPHADYSLVIDADDFMEDLPEPAELHLTEDSYSLDIVDPPLLYPRTQLVNNRLEWCYRGVLHEFMACSQAQTSGHLSWKMRRNHDGARRRNPETYFKDAQILMRVLETEQDPFLRARYTFYLAQSFRDSQQHEQAIRFYQERAGMGGWQEEVYYSLYQVAQLKEHLGVDLDEVLKAYEAASDAYAPRVEALHNASRLCRLHGRYKQGFEIAQRGLGKPYPNGALFGHPWIYETGLLDEYAVNAYWAGHYTECMDACLKILRTGQVSGQELERIVSNAEYALLRLTEKLSASTNAT